MSRLDPYDFGQGVDLVRELVAVATVSVKVQRYYPRKGHL